MKSKEINCRLMRKEGNEGEEWHYFEDGLVPRAIFLPSVAGRGL